jgi:hypothetical protein
MALINSNNQIIVSYIIVANEIIDQRQQHFKNVRIKAIYYIML